MSAERGDGRDSRDGGGRHRGAAEPPGGPVAEREEELELGGELLDALYGERTDRDDDGGARRRASRPGARGAGPARRVRNPDDASPRADANDADAADPPDAELPSGLSGDFSSDLAQLRQLRGLFAELKADEEEPPPAGMALLLAAARQAADERKAAPRRAEEPPAGLWARLRAGWQALAAHPGMAAALAAVVVVSGSGYLMSRGVKTAESTYSDELRATSTAAPAGARAPAADQPAELPSPAEGETSAAPPPTTTGAPAAAPAPPRAEGRAADGVAERQADGDATKQLEQRAAGGDERRRPAKLKATTRPPATERAEEAAVGDEDASAGGGLGYGRGGGKADDDFARKQNSDAPAAGARSPRPDPASPSPPPPPPPPAPTPTDSSAEEGEQTSSAAAAEAPERKPINVESVTRKSERWYALARAAAAKGDCAAVRLLAERVKGEDPSFYDHKFRKDASLQKCL